MGMFLMTLLMITGILLSFIVLLQRGRGGGLAGALGGMGGQSAFGTRAGDVFTKITVGLAIVWVILAGVSGFALRADAVRYEGVTPETPEVKKAPTAEEKSTTPAGTESEAGSEETPSKETEKAKPESKDEAAKPETSGSAESEKPADTPKSEEPEKSDKPAEKPSESK